METPRNRPQLPPLREDIRLFPGDTEGDGSPTWVLQDPLRNRFFRIGWGEFELLQRWGLGDPEQIVQQVNQQTALHLEASHLNQLLQFLGHNQLLLRQGEAFLDQLTHIANQSRRSIAHHLLHRYLFFRIPLVRPDRFLRATYPWVRFAFSRGFLTTILLCSLLGLYLISRRWDSFATTFLHLYSLEGLLLFGVAISLSKGVHELGHAYAATRFGVRVPTMGIAFLVLWPVLYTESSEAWKLPDRRQRIVIAATGMLAELALAACAALLWNFLQDGPARSAVFMLATSTWIITLLINLNPLMRFDGYYLLSDLFGLANLQDRSFELARWRLREALFGLGRPAPEPLAPGVSRWMILYAWATWIYRFFLFLGIALLVYHLFFKALGLFLMMVELAWFIGRPILNEGKAWLQLGEKMRWNRHTLGTAALLLLALGLLALPWQGHTHLPALLMQPAQSWIFPPEPGRLAPFTLSEGERVEAGTLLFRIDAPDLEHQIAQARGKVAIHRLELERKGGSERYLEYRGVLQQQLAESESHLAGLLERHKRLEIRAPFGGQLVYLDGTLRAGRWVSTRTPLAHLVGFGEPEVHAFLESHKAKRLRPAEGARFYAEDLSVSGLPLTLKSLEETHSHTLHQPYLASHYGGKLATRMDESGKIVTERALFRVLFHPSAPLERPLERITRGEVRIGVEPESVLGGFLRSAASTLIRESGF